MALHAAPQPDRTVARRGGLVAGLTAALLAGAALFGISAASADPITCPNGQVSEKVDGGWACVNGGGNTSNADRTKNPTD